MSIRSFSAAKRGGSILHLVAVFGLCLSLAACSETTAGSGGKTGDKGDPGTKKTAAYGISVSMPKGWTVVDSVEPGTVSNAELESRIKNNQPVPLLMLGLPSATNPQQIDARVIIYLADSTKHMPPEQAISQMSQEGLDQLAQNTLQQQNAAAKKANQPGQTLEWKITRENVNGYMALFNRVLGQSPNGNVRAHMWYIYLPNGVGIGIESMGNATHPGIDAMMESIARSLTVSKPM